MKYTCMCTILEILKANWKKKYIAFVLIYIYHC